MPAPDVYKSTIYRNLDELERFNVYRTRLGRGPATYHLAPATHGHLVWERCSSMTEVPDEIFASLTETARTRYGFTIQPTASPLSPVLQLPVTIEQTPGPGARSTGWESLTVFSRTDRTVPDHGAYAGHRAGR